MFFLESPHLMGFLKGSQMLQQTCEQNKLYLFFFPHLSGPDA